MSNGLFRPPRQKLMRTNLVLRDGFKAMEDALAKYGAHTKDCEVEKRELDKCPCGWAQVDFMLKQRGAEQKA